MGIPVNYPPQGMAFLSFLSFFPPKPPAHLGFQEGHPRWREGGVVHNRSVEHRG